MPNEEPKVICEMCGSEIVDDEIYDVDGTIYCEDCIRDHFHISYVEYCRRYA